MKITGLPYDFSVCKVGSAGDINLDDEFCFVGKTDEEISLVCLTESVPARTKARNDGWRALRIEGELDFRLVGILSRISSLLAENGIPIFAVSTYNTDYFFVKSENFSKAEKLLSEAFG